jgi:hypothetical protein
MSIVPVQSRSVAGSVARGPYFQREQEHELPNRRETDIIICVNINYLELQLLMF